VNVLLDGAATECRPYNDDTIFLSTSTQKDINVVSGLIAWALHLLQPPVSSFPSYPEGHFPISLTWLAFVLVADARHNPTLKSKLFRFDLKHHALNFNVVAAFRLTCFEAKRSLAINHDQVTQIFPLAPAYPVELKLVLPD